MGGLKGVYDELQVARALVNRAKNKNIMSRTTLTGRKMEMRSRIIRVKAGSDTGA